MAKFADVCVVVKANIYFDGKVTSRTVEFADGTTKTLGIMLPGEYTFNTGKPELMEITSGDISFCLSGEDVWNAVTDGGEFRIPGNSSFQIKVTRVADYVCSFLDS